MITNIDNKLQKGRIQPNEHDLIINQSSISD